MNAKGHPVARLWWALLVWVAARPTLRRWRGDRPSIADIARRRQQTWEYAEADKQALDAEPDLEGLAQALALMRSDPEEAVLQLQGLALEGSPRAINAVGEHYYWGRSGPREGETWFRRAFERGSRRGMINYGKALYFRKDYAGAAAVFRRGADEDWGPALYWFWRAELSRDHSLETLLRVRPLSGARSRSGQSGGGRDNGCSDAAGPLWPWPNASRLASGVQVDFRDGRASASNERRG